MRLLNLIAPARSCRRRRRRACGGSACMTLELTSRKQQFSFESVFVAVVVPIGRFPGTLRTANAAGGGTPCLPKRQTRMVKRPRMLSTRDAPTRRLGTCARLPRCGFTRTCFTHTPPPLPLIPDSHSHMKLHNNVCNRYALPFFQGGLLSAATLVRAHGKRTGP